jgi:hypothetical protein
MLGFPEIIFVMLMALLSLAPLAIGIWLVVTLLRIRSKQDVLEAKIDALARETKRP